MRRRKSIKTKKKIQMKIEKLLSKVVYGQRAWLALSQLDNAANLMRTALAEIEAAKINLKC